MLSRSVLASSTWRLRARARARVWARGARGRGFLRSRRNRRETTRAIRRRVREARRRSARGRVASAPTRRWDRGEQRRRAKPRAVRRRDPARLRARKARTPEEKARAMRNIRAAKVAPRVAELAAAVADACSRDGVKDVRSVRELKNLGEDAVLPASRLRRHAGALRTTPHAQFRGGCLHRLPRRGTNTHRGDVLGALANLRARGRVDARGESSRVHGIERHELMTRSPLFACRTDDLFASPLLSHRRRAASFLVPSPRIRVVRSSPRGIPERLVRLGDALERRRRAAAPPPRTPVHLSGCHLAAALRYARFDRASASRTRRARDTAREGAFRRPRQVPVSVPGNDACSRLRPSAARAASRSSRFERFVARRRLERGAHVRERAHRVPARLSPPRVVGARPRPTDVWRCTRRGRASTSARVRDASFASSTAPCPFDHRPCRSARSRRVLCAARARGPRPHTAGPARRPSLRARAVRARTRSAPFPPPRVGTLGSVPSEPRASRPRAAEARSGVATRRRTRARRPSDRPSFAAASLERRQLAETL